MHAAPEILSTPAPEPGHFAQQMKQSRRHLPPLRHACLHWPTQQPAVAERLRASCVRACCTTSFERVEAARAAQTATDAPSQAPGLATDLPGKGSRCSRACRASAGGAACPAGCRSRQSQGAKRVHTQDHSAAQAALMQNACVATVPGSDCASGLLSAQVAQPAAASHQRAHIVATRAVSSAHGRAGRWKACIDKDCPSGCTCG